MKKCSNPECKSGMIEVFYRDKLSSLDGAILVRYEPCPKCRWRNTTTDAADTKSRAAD